MEKPEIARLITQLKDESSDVRVSVIKALANIGVPAIPTLLEALKDWKDYQGETRQKVARKRFTQIVEALASIGVPAVPTLIQAIENKNSKEVVVGCAAAALGRIGDTSAASILIDTALTYTSDRLGEHTNVVNIAADALREMRDTSAVPILINALLDDEFTFYRRGRIARVLGRLGDASAAPTLIKLLSPRFEYAFVEFYEFNMGIVQGLGYIGDVSAVPALINVFGYGNLYLSDHASVALAMIGPPAIPALIMALRDKNNIVRLYSAFALDYMGDSTKLPRKIMADSRLSAQERIDALAQLRRVRFKSKTLGYEQTRWGREIYETDNVFTLRYKFPDTRALCRTAITDEYEDVRTGAQEVLDWLNGD